MRIRFSLIAVGIGSFVFLNTASVSAIGLQTYFSQAGLKQRILHQALKLHDSLNPQDKADLDDASHKLYPFLKERRFSIHTITHHTVSLNPTSSIKIEDFEKMLPTDNNFSFSSLTLDAEKISDASVDHLRTAFPYTLIGIDRGANELRFSDITPDLIHPIRMHLPPDVLIKAFSIYAHIPVAHSSIKYKRNQEDSREYYEPSTYIVDTYRALQQRKKEARTSAMKSTTP